MIVPITTRLPGQMFPTVEIVFFKNGSRQGVVIQTFDEISHEWLEKNIPLEKPMLYQWLKAGTQAAD